MKKFRGHKRTFSLDAEEIDGYKVSAKMKKVWQIELEILEKIIQICERHNIEYSLDGGSLIGAIRHRGIIPWDDDIDVIMTRDNYNEFLKYAQDEIGDGYFVKNSSTQHKYYRGMTQICKNNTTAIIKIDLEYDFHCGIFVDIFPLDNIPDDEKERKKFIGHINAVRRWFLHSDNKIKQLLQKIIGIDRLIRHTEKYAQKYHSAKTKECGAIVFRPDGAKLQTKWFRPGNYMKVPFMHLDVSITKDYDAVLKNLFGDYMTPVMGGSMHGDVFFDTEKDYSYYMAHKELMEGKL